MDKDNLKADDVIGTADLPVSLLLEVYEHMLHIQLDHWVALQPSRAACSCQQNSRGEETEFKNIQIPIPIYHHRQRGV